MKKILLSAMAFVAAMSANAQVFQMDGEAQGLTSDLSDVEAGKAWGSIDGALDISNAFATQHKVVDCKRNSHKEANDHKQQTCPCKESSATVSFS